MDSNFYVIKKSAGYAVKTLLSLEKAIEFAKACCKANSNQDYIVCRWIGGMFEEI